MTKITNVSINIDCKDPLKLREFYAKLTGWEQSPDADEYSLLTNTGTTLYFMGCDFDCIQPVWSEEPGKQQKQMHFDFTVDDLLIVVECAISIGAVKSTEQYGDYYVTMFDPERHLFCLIDPKLYPYFLNKN